MLFDIECKTIGREVYQIEAKTPEEATDVLFNKAPKPVLSEVITFEVESISVRKPS